MPYVIRYTKLLNYLFNKEAIVYTRFNYHIIK